MNAFLRTVAVLAAVGLFGYWTYLIRGKLGEHEREILQREEQISTLTQTVEEREERIHELGDEITDLEVAMSLLKVDHRVAQVEVVDQVTAEDGTVRTQVRFRELDSDGEPLGEDLEFEVEGTRLYIESLVIKFEDGFVEAGDELRGTSICLFQRAFGEDQAPEKGTALDPYGVRPKVYSSGDAPEGGHEELWANFWEYAHDPVAAEAKGVRAMHGEAPYTELRPGRNYRIELRSSGGLSITAEE